MDSLIFRLVRTDYQVERVLMLGSGLGKISHCHRIIANELNHSYPVNLAWRSQLILTRLPDGWLFSTWNIGSFISNPKQVEMLDQVLIAAQRQQEANNA